MKSHGIAIAFLAARATSCSHSAQPPPHRYQLSIGPSGQLNRLDITSGDVATIEKAPAISDGRVRLVVGSFYETEGGDVLRYVGSGKFEPRRPLSDIFK